MQGIYKTRVGPLLKPRLARNQASPPSGDGLDGEAADVSEDAVARDERQTEAERRCRDPAIAVVLPLSQRMACFGASVTEPGIDWMSSGPVLTTSTRASFASSLTAEIFDRHLFGWRQRTGTTKQLLDRELSVLLVAVVSTLRRHAKSRLSSGSSSLGRAQPSATARICLALRSLR